MNPGKAGVRAMDRDFDISELYSNEELLRQLDEHQARIRAIFKTLAFRAGVQIYLLERLASLVNHQAFNIVLFILKNGPVSREKLMTVFPSTTLYRYLPQLEYVGVLELQDSKYWLKEDKPQKK
ncbi:MAG: hypothetical protein ACLFVP_08810 [Candidatus Bathyarchaeia archaeon]